MSWGTSVLTRSGTRLWSAAIIFFKLLGLLPVAVRKFYSSYRYYSCGGTWYQQTYQGSSVVYVVVTDPTKAK